MVNATSGFLLSCDSSLKQYILHINDELQSTQLQPSFVVQDLDATHLLVKKEAVPFIQSKIMELQVAVACHARPVAHSSSVARHRWIFLFEWLCPPMLVRDSSETEGALESVRHVLRDPSETECALESSICTNSHSGTA